jgi:hypothetical protein
MMQKRRHNFRPLAVAVLMAITAAAAAPVYEPVGPPATAAFERALYDRFPEYVDGVWPSDARMAAAVQADEIPDEWVQHVQQWLERVLNAPYRPPADAMNSWKAIPKLRWGCDVLLGKYADPDGGEIQFQSIDDDLAFTFVPKDAKLLQLTDARAQDVRDLACRFLAIPKEKQPLLQVKMSREDMAGVSTLMGIITCEFDPQKSDPESQEWFSYMPFWIADGRMFIDVYARARGHLKPMVAPQWHL